LVGKPEGKRPLGRLRHKWEDNIKMDLREIWWGGMDWIDLAEDMDQWRGPVKKAKYLRFHKMLGISWLAEQLAVSQEGLRSMELVNHLQDCVVSYPKRPKSTLPYGNFNRTPGEACCLCKTVYDEIEDCRRGQTVFLNFQSWLICFIYYLL
jgi:hypothetical protein